MSSKEIVVLFSGGVESTTMLTKYITEGWTVHPLYIKSGFKYESEEIIWAEKIVAKMQRKHSNFVVKDIDFLSINWDYGRDNSIPKKRKDIIIPLRNVMLFSNSALYMYNKNLNYLASGILGDSEIPDTQENYLKDLVRLIKIGTDREFHLELPFYGKDKFEILKKYSKDVPFEMTKSCTTMVDGMHCGECAKCDERREGFEKAGIPDPTLYRSKVKRAA